MSLCHRKLPVRVCSGQADGEGSCVMNMILDAALGKYGDLFETVVVLDDIVEVGESWAQLEGRQWNVCEVIQKKRKDLE